MALNWRGDEVTKRLIRAEKEGVNETMAAAVIHAKLNHPWRNRTGIAERSIQVAQPARAHENGVRGVWGSLAVAYFKFLEFGTARMAAKPTLRPAADATYDSLTARINRALNR